MRVGVAVDGKQLLSIAGFLPDGATSLEGSAVSSSSTFLVEKLLQSILGSQRFFLLWPEGSMAALSCPTPCPFPLQVQIQTKSTKGVKLLFFIYVPMKQKLASVKIRSAFKVGLLVRRLSLATQILCVGGSKKHTDKHFCQSVKQLLSCHPLGIGECS